MRGWLLALSSAGLAITAHALGGGGLPDASLTVLLTALAGWTGSALAEKTSSALGVLAVLGTAQLGMHVVLTDLAGSMHHSSPDMYLAHAAATAVTAVLVARAEAMLRIAVARLRVWLPVAWRQAPVPAGPVPSPVPRPPDAPVASVVLSRVHGRRGPPRCS